MTISQADRDVHKSWATCSACGETLLTNSLFDEHRRGPTDSRECVIPDGWVKHREVWGTPEGHRARVEAARRIRKVDPHGQGRALSDVEAEVA